MIKLGFRIRSIRNGRKITLQKLADATKLTTSFISQVERDLVSPSVDSLEKIAKALGVGVGDFFEELKEFTFIRKDGGLQTIDKETKSSCEKLVSNLLGIKMKPRLFRLQKDGKINTDVLSEEGDIFVMVMEGEVEVTCNEERLTLTKKDSFYCKGRKRPQKIINGGEKEAVLLWIRSRE